MTPHSMENLALHSLLRWKMIIRAWKRKGVMPDSFSAVWTRFISIWIPRLINFTSTQNFWTHSITLHTGYISSKEAFLFSLKNRDNKVYKMDIIPGRNGGAMYTGSGYGPTFGEGIEIRDACRFNDHSKSSPGSNYQVPPGYTYGYSNTLLAGSYKFKCTEYEVFYQY